MTSKQEKIVGEEQPELKTFIFVTEPTFAELWDICVYNLMYDIKKYLKDLNGVFKKINITKDSRILDVSAGGGFPSFELIKDGYKIDCMDAMQDEMDVMMSKAAEAKLTVNYKKGYWEDLPKLFTDKYNLLFCRGNSFIYADHGWNQEVEIDQQRSLAKFKEIIGIFYNALQPGGWLYLDKFNDSEVSNKETVARVKVGDGPEEDLIFWTERYPEKHLRRASMLRKDSSGAEKGLPNVTYDLRGPELEQMLKEVGFKNIERFNLESDSHFTVWLAQK